MIWCDQSLPPLICLQKFIDHRAGRISTYYFPAVGEQEVRVAAADLPFLASSYRDGSKTKAVQVPFWRSQPIPNLAKQCPSERSLNVGQCDLGDLVMVGYTIEPTCLCSR
jgi:hypothetical protein